MDDINVYAIPGFREPVNSLSHFLAAGVFAVLSYFLVRRGRGSWCRSISLATMAVTSVFLLSMSGVYHLLGNGTGRYVMKQLDVAGVFALIAGTVTPVHAILFRGLPRWGPLLLVWATAATGITLRIIFWDSFPDGLGIGIFLLMGWGGAISCRQLWKRYGFRFIAPLLWGGLAYTVGAIILGLDWPTVIPGVIGAHELWHVGVLLGLGWHWKFVFQFANGLVHSE